MPVTIEQLPGEPIIMATLEGKICADDLVTMFSRSAELMQSIEGPVYRITDVTNISVSFGDLLHSVAEGSKPTPGTSTDPRVHAHLVGTDAMARLYVEFLKQERNGGVQLPIHKTLDEALLSVRLQIANERKAG